MDTQTKEAVTARTKRVCRCGFETTWPAAMGRHLKGKDPTKHHEIREGVGVAPDPHDVHDDAPCETRTPTECDTAPCDPCELQECARSHEAEDGVLIETFAPPAHDWGTFSLDEAPPRAIISGELLRELIDCRLRLAEAMGQELPPVTREAFVREIERVRELVKEVAS